MGEGACILKNIKIEFDLLIHSGAGGLGGGEPPRNGDEYLRYRSKTKCLMLPVGDNTDILKQS